MEYIEISTLEKISDDATSDIDNGESKFNCYLAYEFDVETLIEGELSDVADEAKLWASDTCPEELHINHGSYIQGGMQHIIEELKNKPSSNRALFSLVSQKHVLNSGDNPIPSFMIFQTSIEKNILYCTAYFRAIEVSTFLRINIEEIRQKLVEIYDSYPNFKIIRLVVFSFRAYHNMSINTLRKVTIDLMTPIKIYKTLNANPVRLSDLLREKAKESTVIHTDSLLALKEALEDRKENSGYNIERVKSLLERSIKIAENLKELRKYHSHHHSISKLADDLSNTLNDVAGEFDKCH